MYFSSAKLIAALPLILASASLVSAATVATADSIKAAVGNSAQIKAGTLEKRQFVGVAVRALRGSFPSLGAIATDLPGTTAGKKVRTTLTSSSSATANPRQ